MDNKERKEELLRLYDFFIDYSDLNDEDTLNIILNDILLNLDEMFKVRFKKISIIEYRTGGFFVSSLSKRKVKAIIDDQIFKIENLINDIEYLKLQKLLKAREEDIDFELKIAEMIDGDNEKFPSKSSYYITQFFKELGFDWEHDGTTKRFWIAEKLKECNIKDIYKIITKGLFKRKYFLKTGKNIEKAIEEFKNIIDECIRANEVLDLTELFNLNFNNELLFNKDVCTNDINLNDLINESKNLYIKGNKQLALEKIWDAFERLKTYYSSNKQKSAEKICDILSSDISSEYFNDEFKKFTKLGNTYQIRHFEIDKCPIQNETTKEYLFFNMLALINFSINKINEVENAK